MMLALRRHIMDILYESAHLWLHATGRGCLHELALTRASVPLWDIPTRIVYVCMVIVGGHDE